MVERDLRDSNLDRIEELGVQLAEKQEELDQQNEYLRAIFNVAISALIVIDDEGKIVDWSPSAQDMFGYTRDEVLGKELAELVIPENYRDQHRKGLALYKETGQGRLVSGQLFEMEAIDREGQQFPVELAVLPLKLKKKLLFVGFIRNVKEREHLRVSGEKYRQLLMGSQENIDYNLKMVDSVILGLESIRQKLAENKGKNNQALGEVNEQSNAD